jgi:hypothetical protein
MANLITVSDVEVRLGRSLTFAEAAKVEALIEDASALVVNYTGQNFTAGTSTNMLQVRKGSVKLSQHPVTAVNTVTNIDGDDVPFSWNGHHTVAVPSDLLANYDYAIVNYDHGYASTPDDVVSVVAGLVVRTFSIAPDAANGITQQTTGPFSVSYAAWAVGGQLVLSPTDQNILSKYKNRVVGSIEILG